MHPERLPPKKLNRPSGRVAHLYGRMCSPALGLEEPNENGAAGSPVLDMRPNNTNRGLGSRSRDTLAAAPKQSPGSEGRNCGDRTSCLDRGTAKLKEWLFGRAFLRQDGKREAVGV